MIRPARSLSDAMGMRLVRNECRLFMTRNTAPISMAKQTWWWLRLPSTTWPLVVQSDQIIGYGLIVVGENKAWLTGALTKRERHRGLGRRLFMAMIALAQHSCLEPWLEVRESNAPALHLYSSLGFEVNADRGMRGPWNILTMRLAT